jgi:aminopeptidase N
MTLIVPNGYLTISNGKLVSKTKAGDGWTAHHWREDVPHSTYLNSFAVGKFSTIEEEAEGVPLQYYFPESKKDDARRLFGLTPDMLRSLESLTGTKYPFEKYSQVTVHDFFTGGMENISATTLTDTRFPDARSEEDYAARYSRPDRNHIELLAHELAHMWFGDLVTAKHWSHLWLNEGFATYFQALYTEKKFGVDEFRHDMFCKAETYFKEDETLYRRAIVDDTYVYADDVFDSCTYEKAAWMIHQLRFVLGDELFLEATREYLSKYAGGNVDTHDYMKILEKKSGLSLEAHFEQSFFKAGHPEFEVSYSWDEATRVAEVRVKQAQQEDALTPVFSLPCQLVFYVPTAATGAGNGRLVRRIKLGSREETFQFQLDGKPTVVEFDPEERLLKKVKFEKAVTLLLNQLEGSVDASSRRRAAEGLSSFRSDPDVIGALERALSKEQHYSVGAEAAASLGKIGSKDALEALLAHSNVGHRRVRRAVIAALGEFKDEKVAQPLLAALRSDESPYVQCEAALSYGKVGRPDAFSVLTSSVGLPSPEHAITEACLEALGYVKGPQTRDFLKKYLPYGNPTRVRVGALKAYYRLGWLTEEEVALLKELLLKDKVYTVRAQVLETISELLDRRFLPAVKEAAEEDIDPRLKRRAMEVALMLSDAASVENIVSDVKDDLEKVKKENREFKERFSSMELS